MTSTIRASSQGLEIIEQYRKKKVWDRQSVPWCQAANVSMSTLKRFLQGKAIQREAFIAICQAVGIENWEELVDKSPVEEHTQISAYFNYDDSWVGRVELISHLSAKVKEVCRVLLLTGITGIGKTSLAERLTVELQKDLLKSFRINFDHQKNTDFVSVATQLLNTLGKTVAPEISQQPQQLLSLLVEHLCENRYLVIIDALENILKGNEKIGWSDFQDDLWVDFFQKLLSANYCESRLILTSQDLPGQLQVIGFRYPNFWYCQSLKGLTESEWLELFQKIGLEVDTDSLTRNYLKRFGAAYEGHPLALRVIAGEIINHPFNGDVVAYWKQYGHEVEEVEQSQKHSEIESKEDQFKLAQYNRWLRRSVKERIELTFERLAKDFVNSYQLLGYTSVYRCPVPENFYLKILERLGFDEDGQLTALDVLRDRYLIEEEIINHELLLRQHNLIRSVALEHLKKWKNDGNL